MPHSSHLEELLNEVVDGNHTMEDEMIDHMNQYGYVKGLRDYEKEIMSPSEISRFNSVRTQYNKEHRDDVREAKEREHQEMEDIRNDPSLQ